MLHKLKQDVLRWSRDPLVVLWQRTIKSGVAWRKRSSKGLVLDAQSVEARTRALTEDECIDRVHEILGWQFTSRELLRDALTHRSYLNEIREPRPSNERLEFLGDSVLSIIVTDYLFIRFPDMSEGELTNVRSALVRTETLARFGESIGLGTCLLIGKGEDRSRGRYRPSGLACAFEALIGAVYLDKGLDVARNYALQFVEPAIGEVLELRLHRNGKSTLQEIAQSRWQRTPSYHVVDEDGPDHSKSFTVEVRVGQEILGRGIATNKRTAEQRAAKAALASLSVEI